MDTDSFYDTTTQEYVEVIRDIENEKRVARVKDIAERRGVSRSSVSIALNQLIKKNLITHEQYGHVTLTEQGRKLAQDLERRHQAIKKFLIYILGVAEEVADQDACKLEHHVSQETLEKLSGFVDFIENCPTDLKKLIEYYQACAENQSGKIDCDECQDVIFKMNNGR